MEDCELCGKPTNEINVVNVEGAELRVCSKCAKGEKVIKKENGMESRPKGTAQREAKQVQEEPEIIEGYGRAIREAREGMKLPLKVLAEMLNEKETLLLRIEEEKTQPNDALIKKLEKSLNIALTAKPKAEGSYRGRKNDNVTIGDFIIKH